MLPVANCIQIPHETGPGESDCWTCAPKQGWWIIQNPIKGRRLLRSGSFSYFILLCLMFRPNSQSRYGKHRYSFRSYHVLLVPLTWWWTLVRSPVLQLIKVILQKTIISFVKPAGLSTSLAMAWLRSRNGGLVLQLCHELVEDWMQPSSTRISCWSGARKRTKTRCA